MVSASKQQVANRTLLLIFYASELRESTFCYASFTIKKKKFNTRTDLTLVRWYNRLHKFPFNDPRLKHVCDIVPGKFSSSFIPRLFSTSRKKLDLIERPVVRDTSRIAASSLSSFDVKVSNLLSLDLFLFLSIYCMPAYDREQCVCSGFEAAFINR